MEKVKNFILTVIISIIIGSAGTYILYKTASDRRIEQYRLAESTAIAASEQLRKELSESNKRLSSINAELQQNRTFNTEARIILSSQRSSIDKLKENIGILQK